MTYKGTGPADVGDGAEKQITGRGSHAATTLQATTDETCWLCLNGASTNRWQLCDRCLTALFRQIRRRRDAAARMAPLEDGRRDVLERPRWSA